MRTPFYTTPVSGRFGVSLFSEHVSVQDKQRFALLSFTVDKFCHIGVHCIGALCLMICLCDMFHYQNFLNYDSIIRLKINV